MRTSPPGLGLRGRLINRLYEGAFERVEGLTRLHPESRRLLHGVEVLRDIRYRDDEEPAHALDVYSCDGFGRPLPIVLYAHGGGFRILSKDSHWGPACAFAKRGWLVFNIDYRMSPHAYPAALEDACAAFVWLTQNAENYGGDLGRILLAGDSAGANLMTTVALAACWPRVEPHAREVYETGIVPRLLSPSAGFLQVSAPERYLRRRDLPWWIKDRVEMVSRTYLPDGRGEDLADPLCFLERASAPERPFPATFLGIGSADPVADDSVRMGAALERLDIPVSVRRYDGGFHAFNVVPWRALARRYWADQEQFCRLHLRASAD